ncbi:MAG TPA: NAD(P)H-dependent oxidoreductase subunit E, partial [Burkholderiales bacterium]|nr:NAD(P)H-dependent oxidoreductase subunit E [Burkholderiales bacterium]
MSSVAGEVDSLVGRMGERPLQILIEIQKHFNQVSIDAIDRLASRLELPVARILGNVEFYSFLSREKQGDYSLLMSDNITDWMLGSRELHSRLRKNLEGSEHASVGRTSCTGMCDQGPAMLVNGIALTNLDEKRIDGISSLVEKHVPVSSWPSEYFHVESNIRRSGWLFEGRKGNVFEGEALLRELRDSNLRGRGGAGFPTALKWATCRDAEGEKYVVCNADEGEPGTFKDRILLTHCAENLLEGMALCAHIIGAKKGFLYVRGEYRYLESHLRKSLREKRFENFEIELQWGAGAYICGEESALLESIEG